MDKLRNALSWVADNPDRSILFLLSFVLVVSGLAVYLPGFIPTPGLDPTIGFISSIFYFIVGGFGMFGALANNRPAIYLATFSLGIALLFLGILQLASVGWFPLRWLTLMAFGLICFVLRLSLAKQRITRAPLEPVIIHIPGPPGRDGRKGEPGTQGAQGSHGDRGDVGSAGVAGKQGEQGIEGEQGIAGKQGLVGEQGLSGDQGEAGEQGVEGERGEKGILGEGRIVTISESRLQELEARAHDSRGDDA